MLSDKKTILWLMLSSDQKGAVAEAAIAHAALELGIGVARPLGDQRYDLIFDLRARLVRVQCKWACRQRDVIVIRCYSSRRSADGFLRQVYGAEEVDAFAAYCADVGRCYFLPLDAVPPSGAVQLRLAPPLNKQRRRIRRAEEYELAATLGRTRGP
jgi:hypothetical protein